MPAEKAESWLEKTWCEDGDFVEEALAAKGAFVVSGMTGCALSSAPMPREKGSGRAIRRGIRVAQAVQGKTVPRPQWLPWFWRSCILRWALMSLDKLPGEENIWGMVVGRDGNVLSHPDPSRIASNRPDGAVRVTSWGNPVNWRLGI